MEAYSPYPIDELSGPASGRTAMPAIVFAGGCFGLLGGFLMQYYAAAIDYPLNIGGRPLNSWPSFIPVTFELTVLCAALAGLIGMLALNRLPMPYHPVFNVPEFGRASQDRFFLCDRGDRSPVRSRRHVGLPRRIAAGGSDGGAAVRMRFPRCSQDDCVEAACST